ncbi:methylmalonyl Co-A mutase-associated GTPase MeaB [Desulfovermiculus halophilus]|jgi:LAO/AO transport system kinase|uniref:methylmalonyl Co-A mutase-associated GTPase MeaB n=1 Tax=Desulfovermiculus halophilus TaxID=339722 RepID=UPI0009FD66CD|nr:methylmalonyl Co-A mutase-associated GTPase MeaB [Desulfovermiculus halophilus]
MNKGTVLAEQTHTPAQGPNTTDRIVERIRNGDVRTVSRLIRNIEDKNPRATELIKSLFPLTGRAHVIGLTGAPGAGKSTLSDALITNYRKQGKTVGVLAVDPTSPFTGGAILGDRVRMQKHAEDKGVFIRSLATRGALGGLSDAVDEAIHVLDAMGKDIILVETVGTGQSEVDIMNNAHSILLVLTPGMGDEVQTIKAGVMEIADLFVINKADQPGAAKLLNELTRALDMADGFRSGWRPPILTVENLAQSEPFLAKVDQVRSKIDEHYELLRDSDVLKERERRKAGVQLKHALDSGLVDKVVESLHESGKWEEMLTALAGKQSDPYSLTEDIVSLVCAEDWRQRLNAMPITADRREKT